MNTCKELYIRPFTNDECKAYFESDPGVAALALPDEGWVDLRNGESCFGIIHDGEIMAVIRCNEFTNTSLIMHVALRTEYRGKGLAAMVKDLFGKYIADTTNYIKLVCPAPDNCKYAQKAMEIMGCEKEGVFKDMVVWRNKLVDLHWYTLDLRQYRSELCL